MRGTMMAGLWVLAAPALAQEGGSLRTFCGDRPGLGTPACTVDPGHLQLELGLGDWTLDRQGGTRTDTVLAGAAALRLGVTPSTELRLEWQAYGHVRLRDGGAVSRAAGIGDVTVGLKQNLRSPDGQGFAVAVLPFATLPAGHDQVGAGTWSAGLIVPISYDLADRLQLEITPEIDAAPDEDGRGRHLAYSSVFGLIWQLSQQASLTAEIQPLRDHDPDGHATRMRAGLSLAYLPREQTQLDVGANAGLNHDTPDIQVSFGISRKF